MANSNVPPFAFSTYVAIGLRKHLAKQVEDDLVTMLLEDFEKKARQLVREYTKDITVKDIEIMKAHYKLATDLDINIWLDGERADD